MDIEINKSMDPKVIEVAENVLFNMWYTVAEKIFKKVVEVAQLDDDQIKALKTACLRPNDFRIRINDLQVEEVEDEQGHQ